jgi:hypothetical protein
MRGVKMFSDLIKARQHKYIKRVPKAGGGYTYFYREQHGGGVALKEHMKEGAAFRLTHNGQEGHFHIKALDGERLTVEHDETRVKVEMTRDELAALLTRQHRQALQADADKKRANARRMERDKPNTPGAKRAEKLAAEAEARLKADGLSTKAQALIDKANILADENAHRGKNKGQLANMKHLQSTAEGLISDRTLRIPDRAGQYLTSYAENARALAAEWARMEGEIINGDLIDSTARGLANFLKYKHAALTVDDVRRKESEITRDAKLLYQAVIDQARAVMLDEYAKQIDEMRDAGRDNISEIERDLLFEIGEQYDNSPTDYAMRALKREYNSKYKEIKDAPPSKDLLIEEIASNTLKTPTYDIKKYTSLPISGEGATRVINGIVQRVIYDILNP